MGQGKILRHNVLKETFIILLDSNQEEVEVSYKDIIDNKAQKEAEKGGSEPKN